MNNQQRLSKRNLWCYSVSTVGRDMAAAGLFMGHLLNYILFTKSLTAQQFTAVSVIMVAARVFDAFNDPVMGNILDATRSRWGKFKPWILAGVLLTTVVVIASFTNTLQGWGYVLLFGVLYFAYSICFTMNDIAYWGMLPSLTSVPDDRNRLTSLTTLMAGVGAFLTGLIVPTFTAGDRVIGGSAVTAYAVIAVIFCAVMLGTQALTLFGVKERPQAAQAEPRTRVSLRSIVGTIRGNDQVLWSGVLLFIYFIVSTTSTAVSTSYLYLSFGYNGLLSTLFVTLGYVASAVVFILFAPISRRFSRRRLVQMATLLSAGAYGLMLVLGLLLPAALGMGKFAALAAANLFASLGNNVFYLVMMINIANAVEYNEYKQGRRNEGIIFSVRPFVTKLGMALGQFFTMLVYVAAGVLSVTNQISGFENAAAQGEISAQAKAQAIQSVIGGVPAGQTAALLCFMSLLPAAGMLAAYWLYSRKITLTEERYDAIVAELEARRAAGPEAAGATAD